MTETDQRPAAAPEAGSSAHDYGDAIVEVRDLFVEWLTANGIDPDLTPMWAELRIDPDEGDSGTIHIEQMVKYGERVLPAISGTIITRIRSFPLREPMGEDLADTWERMAGPQRRLLQLQFALKGSGATVVPISQGQKMLFVLQGRPKNHEADLAEEKLTQTLRGLLPPGIEVGIVYGVQAVVVQAA